MKEKVIDGFKMKWYKFLVYFYMFYLGVVDILGGCLLLGFFVSTMFGNEMAMGPKLYCGICGILTLAAGIFAIFGRLALAKFKKEGPGSVYLVYLTTIIVNIYAVIYSIVALFASDTEVVNNLTSNVVSTIIGLVVNIVILALNYVYFEKREKLFNK